MDPLMLISRQLRDQRKLNVDIIRRLNVQSTELGTHRLEIESQQRQAALQNIINQKTKDSLRAHARRHISIVAGDVWKCYFYGLAKVSHNVWFDSSTMDRIAVVSGMLNVDSIRLRETARSCILARNELAHFEFSGDLDNAVTEGLAASNLYPEFEYTPGNQIRTLKMYAPMKSNAVL